MRTKLFITLLSGVAALVLNSTAAFADDSSPFVGCTGSVMLGLQYGDPYQDFGFDATKKTPGASTMVVSKDMLALTCGHFTADWLPFTQLSGGKYGRRGKGDEQDFELTYANSVNTPIGELDYSAYIGYYALDLGRGLGSTADDYVQTYLEGSLPIPVWSWTLTPFVRYVHNFPLGNGDHSLNWFRSGLRLNGPLTLPIIGETNVSLEVAHADHTDPAGIVLHQKVWRGDADLSKPLGDGWAVTAGAQFTEFVGVTPMIHINRAL